MIERRVVRLDQLTRGDTVSGPKFRKFLETNEPSARVAGTPNVGDAKSPGTHVTFGIALQWDAGTTHKERTVNLECVLEPVRGGWAIREIRFPTGFSP
jgi:hypothetical protein